MEETNKTQERPTKLTIYASCIDKKLMIAHLCGNGGAEMGWWWWSGHVSFIQANDYYYI